ncbi:translation initiation factor [Croceiramulus getboli]|nr:translation initiation factor [Flavobacteriaceae bacterium YJPT1-3]
MDLKDQLSQLFPDHQPEPEAQQEEKDEPQLWMQDDPLICKYEKRKGKPITIIEGYTGADEDFKLLAKELKSWLGVGGSFKNERILIQGDYRDKIMTFLQEKGFKTKRVGG